MKNCFKSLETKSGRMDLLYSLLAIVIGIVFLFPLYWLVQISFKTDTETFGKVLTYFPRQITIDPWLVNLKDPVFLLSLRNSFINGFLTMAITVLLGVPAAYGTVSYTHLTLPTKA